jgi:cell wall-associated NlpC family hydrolase
MDDLISGDLVFFGSSGDISHVGVYVGKGRFVHAPNSGGTVRLDDIDGPYWRDHFVYGKRLLD